MDSHQSPTRVTGHHQSPLTTHSPASTTRLQQGRHVLSDWWLANHTIERGRTALCLCRRRQISNQRIQTVSAMDAAPLASQVSFSFCTWRTQRRQYAAQRTMDRRWLDPDRSSAERGPGRSTSAHRGGGGGRPAAGVGVGYWVAGFRGRLTIHPSIGLNGDDDDLT
jgi:hypothetical protein